MRKLLFITLLFTAFGSHTYADIQTSLLTSASSIADASSYSSGSFSATPYTVLIGTIVSSVLTPDGDPATPTMTGTNGLNVTWTQVGTATFDTIASPGHRITVFRAVATSNVAGTVTWDFGGESQTASTHHVIELHGCPVTNGGADAIRNVGTNNADASTSITVTLGAFNDADNATLAFFGADANNAFTGEDTEIVETGTTGVRLMASIDVGNDTTPSATIASSDLGAVAFEVIDSRDIDWRVVTSDFSSTDANSYATASVTPLADTPYLLLVAHENLLTPPTVAPTVTSTGLSWTQEATVVFETIATSTIRITAYSGAGASPSAGAITMDFSGVTQSNCSWVLMEFVGGDPDDPVVQTATDATDTTGDTSTAITLGAFADSLNGTLFVAAHTNGGASSTPGTPFIEYRDNNIEAWKHMVMYSGSNQTSSSNTWSSGGRNAGIALEIRALAAPNSSGAAALLAIMDE